MFAGQVELSLYGNGKVSDMYMLIDTDLIRIRIRKSILWGDYKNQIWIIIFINILIFTI